MTFRYPFVADPPAARRLLAGAVREKAFQQNVGDEATLRKWTWYHTWNSRWSTGGFPDFLALRGESIVVAELKSLTGKLTLQQRVWLVAWWQAGAAVYVWTPLESWQVSDVLR